MSSFNVVRLDNFDTSKVAVGKVKDNRNGPGKSANLSYEGGRFYVAMTDMRFPFGASKKPDEFKKGDKDQWTMQCELTEQQIELFKRLDEHIMDQCLEMPEVLSALKLTKKSRDVLDSKYWSVLKYSKDKDGNVKDQYPPTIRITIPNDNADGFNCNFFTSANGGSEPVTVDNVPESENNIGNFLAPNIRGSVLIGMSLWFSSSGFGVTLRANQIKAEPQKRLAKGVCLLDGLSGGAAPESAPKQEQDPDLSEEEEAASEPEALEELEEELEESDEPEPEPSPPKAKRTVRKTVTAKK